MTELLHWSGETFEINEDEAGNVTIVCFVCGHRSGRAQDRTPPYSCGHCDLSHSKLATLSTAERFILARPSMAELPIVAIPLPPTRLEAPFVRLLRRLENYRRVLVGERT